MLKNLYIVSLLLFVSSSFFQIHTIPFVNRNAQNENTTMKRPTKRPLKKRHQKISTRKSPLLRTTPRIPQKSIINRVASPQGRSTVIVKKTAPLSKKQSDPLFKAALLVATKRKTLHSASPIQRKTIQQSLQRKSTPSRLRKKPQHTPRPLKASIEWEKVQKQALFIWPIKLSEFWVSSFFGPRKKPNGIWGFHSGLDLAATRGTLVHAAGEGIVTEATHMPGYGNYILIVHNEEYKTRYAHLDRILVKRGQKVLSGDVIGKVGATGTVRKTRKSGSGSHLHFEIYQEAKRINPLFYLA
ncbi:M23 family metallopeptidase [Candidatus Dependentiae bacterium]|nr:M23 family metallopeptidase [Candidatus Dependentiae bacterium]